MKATDDVRGAELEALATALSEALARAIRCCGCSFADEPEKLAARCLELGIPANFWEPPEEKGKGEVSEAEIVEIVRSESAMAELTRETEKLGLYEREDKL